MAKTEFIAAIELSSSKITGIAGNKKADGSIMIGAFAQEDASRFVKKGVVLNISEAAKAIGSIIQNMETQLSSRIAKAYLSISGQTVRTVKNVIKRTVTDGDIVTEDLISQINDENRNYPIVDADILDVVPQEYDIDNTTVIEPIGVAGHDVTATFLNIVARSYVKKNLNFSAQQAHLELADDMIVGPKALAAAIVSEAERRSGCALVDIGAATTTVAVFKNNLLRYLSVLPLGSGNIDKDLTVLQIEEDEARRLKEEHGNALTDNIGPVPEGFPVKDWELSNDIVAARTEEILKNVWNQISLSGYSNKLYSGIILTGGGSRLKNLEDAFRKSSGQTKMKVKTVLYPEFNIVGPSVAIKHDGTLNTIYGMLLLGRENCSGEEETVVEDTYTSASVLSANTDSGEDLFKNDEELNKQAEAAAKAKEDQKKRDEQAKIETEKKRRADEKRKREEEKKRRNKGTGLFTKISKKADIIAKTLFDLDDNSDSMGN